MGKAVPTGRALKVQVKGRPERSAPVRTGAAKSKPQSAQRHPQASRVHAHEVQDPPATRMPGRSNALHSQSRSAKANGYAARLLEIRGLSMSALEGMHIARELGLQASRSIIQLSSQAIRAAHRGEFDSARELVHDAGVLLAKAGEKLESQPVIRYSGFMHDGEKEYVEAAVTTAFVSGGRIPDLRDLSVSPSAYVNGLAEAASELRRSALDAMRRSDPARADELLSYMDEAMGVVETIDFPEAVTGGLRRTTDALRGVVERTRGDVTAALRQQSLENRLRAIESRSQ